MHRGQAIDQNQRDGTGYSVSVGNRLDKYIVWPVTAETVTDEVLERVWQIIEDTGRVDDVFYSGKIVDVFDFIEFMHAPEQLPILVWDKANTRWCMLAWLNNYDGEWAWCHFCGLEGMYRPTMAKAGLEAYSEIVEVGLVGVTPETNKPALKLVQNLGWKRVGAIPKMCYMAKEDKRVSGIVSHYLFRR